MKNVLIIGALPFDDDRLKLYEVMIGVCAKEGKEVLSPIDTKNFKGTDEERYERAFKSVEWSDLVIAELSQASTGQGMEIRESTILNKDLLAISRENGRISGLVLSAPNLCGVIYYKDLDDLSEKLEYFFERMKGS